MVIASIFDVLVAPFSWAVQSAENSIISIAFLLMVWVVKKYLVPLIGTEIKQKTAELILRIADDITDELVANYPDKKVYQYLDIAVDKLMEACGVSKEVATRVIKASFGRKGIKAKE